MLSEDMVVSLAKDEIEVFSKGLKADEIETLVGWLGVKEDKLRYSSLLLLQARARYSGDVYGYWNIFREKLKSDNSYQRSIGLMIIACNVRWDGESRFEEAFDDFCALLHDEKPITVRQCIQAFAEILPYKPELYDKTAEALMSLDISCVKETMQKLILTDIINILLLIRQTRKAQATEDYISGALLGGILDKKAKKDIESRLLA